MADTPTRIVKVQLDMTGERILIYDENRENAQEIVRDADPSRFQEILDATKIEPLTKTYWYAARSSKGDWWLTEPAEVQQW